MNRMDPTGMEDGVNGDPFDENQSGMFDEDKDEPSTFEKIQNWFTSTIENLFSTTEQAVEDLPEFVADGAVIVAESTVETAKGVAEKGVQVTAKVADGTSDVATVGAVVGLVAAPFTGTTSLGLTASCLAVSTGADVVSTMAKTSDAVFLMVLRKLHGIKQLRQVSI